MIQRVQSLFLLAASFMMLMIFVWPLASYYSDTMTVVLHLYKIESVTALPGGGISVSPVLTGFISFLTVVVAILCTIIIFKYKSRPAQIKLLRISLIINIVFIVTVFALTDFIRKGIGIIPEYGTSAFFPVVALMFQLLAMRFIRKDEEMVKSADRLR